MCDPEIMPIMCKQVQAACQVFPSIITKVIDYYNLPIETFDELYEKHDNNVIYRFRVISEIKKLEKMKKK